MTFTKKAKIVVTLGPATDSEESVKELIKAGANVFRFNTSHGEYDYHKAKIRMVKKVAEEMKVFVATLVDLQGPKIRIGKLNKEIPLNKGDEIVLEHYEGEIKEGIIPVDYKGIADDVKKDAVILVDDGKIQLKVKDINDNKVYTEVIVPNILKPRKGINIPGSTASLSAVTERDIEFIKLAVNEDVDFIALSFVREKNDVLLAKKYIQEFNGDIPVVAKMEKPQSMANLSEIVSSADAVMVARGDLGIELSPVEVPICQKKIIQECSKYKKPVIVATQMLESMIDNPIPTRAESSDVANAILDGADAVMLSAETSVGKYATEAVKMMSEIIIATEASGFYKYDYEPEMLPEISTLTRQAIVTGADRMIKTVNAKAVLSFSHSGKSTKIMSKMKPKVPIILICDTKQTARRMALSWGVFSYYKNWDETITGEILLSFDEFLINEIGLKTDDYVIIIGSQPNLITSRTNFVRVHRIGA